MDPRAHRRRRPGLRAGPGRALNRAPRLARDIRAAFPASAALPGLRLLSVGHIPRKDRPQFTPGGRRLDAHGLFLFHAGTGAWRTHREGGRLAPGTLLLFRAGEWHCFDPDPGGFLCESWLLLDGPLADRLIDGLAGAGRTRFAAADPAHLAARWRELLDLALLGPAHELRAATLALDLVAEALGADGAGRGDDAVARFVRLAGERADADTCPLAAFLAREGVGGEAFRKAFRRRLGLFPRQYWQRRKLDHARILLSQEAAPVRAVAAACGFADPCQFSRWFRRGAGEAPRAFRARHRAATPRATPGG